MFSPASVTGLVLAGGLGRRMGGADKGLQLLAGRPMVARVIERLAPQVASILVSANRNLEAYAAFGYPVIPDRLAGFMGPLAGLHVGLMECRTEFLACVPCDSPALPVDLVARLYERLVGTGADVAAVHAAKRLQPTFALMRSGVGASIEAFLMSGGRSVTGWVETQRFVAVDFDDANAFANLNTPDDMRTARAP